MTLCIVTYWTQCYRGFDLTDGTPVWLSGYPSHHCTLSEHVISPLWVLDAGDTVIEPHTESNRATNPPILKHVFTLLSPAVSHPSTSTAAGHTPPSCVHYSNCQINQCPLMSCHYTDQKAIVHPKIKILSFTHSDGFPLLCI